MTDRPHSSQQPPASFEPGTARDSKQLPALDSRTANKILNTALEMNKMAPSSIPVEVLEGWGNYNMTTSRLAKKLTYVLIIITLLLPLLVFKPMIFADRINVDEQQAATAIYNVSVKGIMPVSSVSATLDGEPLPVIQSSSRHFTIEAKQNGELVITASAINGQVSTRTYHVRYKDTDHPQYAGSRTAGDFMFITIEDGFSGVDWNSIEGITPVSVDEAKCEIKIEVPSEPTNMKISDNAGNTLELIVKP